MVLIRLTPYQAISVYGYWSPKKVLSWKQVEDHAHLTWKYLRQEGLSVSDLYKLQPDPKQWMSLDRIDVHDIREMSSWNIHPIHDMKCTLSQLALLHWSADALVRVGVTYDDLVKQGLTVQVMPIFGFTLLDWSTLGLRRNHLSDACDRDCAQVFASTGHTMLRCLVSVIFVSLVLYDTGWATSQFPEKQHRLASNQDNILHHAKLETKSRFKRLARETTLNQTKNVAHNATTKQKILWGSKLHAQKQKRDRYTLRRSAASRRLLYSAYLNTNTFDVDQVYEFGDNVMVQVHYSTSSNVIPIFMFPHYNIQEKSMLWGTFNTANNPCLLRNGVTTLCCISALIKTHKISSNYEDISKFLCRDGVASTAATIAIPQLYQATEENTVAGTVHTNFDGLLQDASFHSYANINEDDSTDGKHVVDLHMSREFISNHSRSIRDGLDTGIDLYRFFIGVTFSELQFTNTIWNSAALSVITLLRNSSSSELLCSLVSKDTLSSISHVQTLLYSVTQYSNTYYFMRIEIETDTRLGSTETAIDPASVRWSLGLQGGGVSTELQSRNKGDWIQSCTFTHELVSLAGVSGDFSSANLCQTNTLVTETVITLSMTLPIGVNLPLDMHVLYTKFTTDHTVVTKQMLLATTPRHAIINQLPRETALIQERIFLEESHLAIGLTDTGVVKQLQLELLPYQSIDSGSIVVLGMAGSLVSNASTALGNLISLSMPIGYKIQSLFLVHFVGSSTLSTLTASEDLHQALHLGELFDPTNGQEQLTDFCNNNTICISQQVVVNETFVVETEFPPMVLYDDVSDCNITSTSEETVEWVRNKLNANADIMGVENLIENVQRSVNQQRLMLVDPSVRWVPSSSVMILLTVTVGN
ncbi:hypothetical protein T484DRAFT_1757701 [Baffinella frigidus]|nr:hypothetical protein T484DRAFT_1757701 [Cryptophyta sp. CCMP2293]